MSTNTATKSGGIGFIGLLTILFIGLKLTHYINWSWWWVLSPIWIIGAVVLIIIFVAGGIALGTIGYERYKRNG